MIDHEAFSRRYNALESETEKQTVLKNYMLGLSSEELDDFMFGNIQKLREGLQELSANGALTKEYRAELSVSFAEIEQLASRIGQPKQAA